MKDNEDRVDSQPPVVQSGETDRQTQPVDHEAPPRLSFPVVGVGASAGGLEAFSEFFKAMSTDCGMAFVLIQHLPPDRDSMIAEILSRHTKMPVSQVEDGLVVEKNHVYVIRPGYTLTIKDGALHLGERLAKRGHDRPVDDFFKSLAEEQRERAIAIIMSGMGSNGAAGAQAIKAVGGLCIAQEPESAQFPSMPRHLIDAGYADFILRASEMPAVLLQYVNHPYVQGGEDSKKAVDKDQQHLREVLAIIRTRTRHDFSGYKKPTVLRRVQRRMGLNHLGTLSEYTRLLRQSTTEVISLADDLLIHVTGFFRDPESWETLRRTVVVPLIASRDPNASVRCWVAACSSGEEAYTLAMLLMEEAERIHKPLDIKVFATDTAERTLVNARMGTYPGGIEAEISPSRLDRFFQKEDAVYRVRQDLRQAVVFAPQNILQDPPFSRLDIASCRNLLIYLEPGVQTRVLSMLHFGLREGGVLFLGTSETIGDTSELFETMDKKARIFRRVGLTRHGLVDFPLPRSTASGNDTIRNLPRLSIAQLTNNALLARHVPAAVTVDRDSRIVYFHGDTQPFLSQPTGEPTRDLLVVALEGVRGAVRMALQRSMSENSVVTVLDGWINDGRDRKRIAVTASPLDLKGASDFFVVSFEERAEPEPAASPDETERPTTDAATSAELRRVRDELQSTIEELQTSNEEHRASAEEVMSMNEEMQSTNEELETSREEMQSLNEELTTVNTQLMAKMEEYQAISNDLTSLLTSTDIAVLFLDPQFGIRRFTPSVKELIELIATDIGRPLRDLAWKFTDPDLISDSQAVLDKLVPREKEILAENGVWYIRKVLPYRTSENRIDGLVITFVDISERKRMSASLAERARLLDLSNDVIIVRDMQNRIIYWNQGATDLYGWTADEARGKDIHSLLRTEPPDAPSQLIERIGLRERMIGEVVQRTRDGQYITTLCRWAVDRNASGDPTAILTTATDVTEQKMAERAVSQNEQQFRLLVDAVRDFAIFMLDTDGCITTWNPGAERLLGWVEEETIGKSGSIIFTPHDRDAGAFNKELAQAAQTGRAVDERWHLTKEGRRFWGSGVMAALEEPSGVVRGFVKILRDETARKTSEDALVAAKRAAESANRMKDEFLATLSHELRTPLSAILLWTKVLLGKKIKPEVYKEALSAIKNSADAQTALIDDLLDTSRIISGKLRLQLRKVELTDLLQDAIDAVLPAANAKDIMVNSNFARDVGLVMADADRLSQVVWNLLTNAVKFTASGGKVEVTLSRRGESVEIRVTDTGRGIKQEFLPYVFDRFRQEDASSTQRHGGLGLGLDIAKQLVELHGGSIDAFSEGVDQGATFTVKLPLPKMLAEKPVPYPPKSVKSKTPDARSNFEGTQILLVEDEQTTGNALAFLLRQAGARVTLVESSAAALNAYNNEQPDLILSDIGLPDQDGYSLIGQIRKREAETGADTTPAMALTAFAREEDRQRAMLAGFQQHLRKPIEPDKLLVEIQTLLRIK